MNLESAILVVLSSLPVPKVDAQEVNRIERLEVITNAIATAADRATCRGEFAVTTCKPIANEPEQVAAELIAIANAESALRSNVGADECGVHQCDPVKIHGVISHRARSYWQLHRPKVWSDARWESIRGSSQEATTEAAWTAAKILAGGHGVCHTTEGAVTFYGVGGMCHSYAFDKAAASRAAAIGRVRGKLWALTHEASK